MGIKFNNSKISMKSTDNQYPYYSNSQVNEVYVKGTLVWKKYTPIPFTFNGSTVTGYTGSDAEITIPSTYSMVTDIDGTEIFMEGTDYTVTAIGDDAFASNTTLTAVTIPDTITTVGARAFQFCYNLATVTLTANLTSIGYCAFALTNLSAVSSYMYSATTIGQGAFAFRNHWHIHMSGISETQARTILGSHLGELSKDGYVGHGTLYGIYAPHRYARWSGGTTTPRCGGYVGWEIPTTWYTGNSGKLSYTSSFGISGGDTQREFTTPTCTILTETTAPTATCIYNGTYSEENINSKWCQFEEVSGSTSPLVAGELTLVTPVFYCSSTCIVKGTLITLADGTQKPIEDLSYSDLLLVWNFETGSYDYQYPLIIMKSTTTVITRITLEDNSFIEISGLHDIYDPVKHEFIQWGNGNISIKKQDYYMFKINSNKEYKVLKVIDVQCATRHTDCYGLVTGGTITAFANNIMIGNNLLNYSRINSQHIFEKEFEKDKEMCYTYDRFKKEISPIGNKYTVLGMCMHYAPLYFNYTPGIERFIRTHSFNLIPIPTKDNKYLCTIGILENNTLKEVLLKEDEEFILPNITEPNKTKWYVVGEYKYLNPGDSYTINFSTIIRAV